MGTGSFKHCRGNGGKGIEVTLFTTGDSITKGKLFSVCERPFTEEPTIDPKVEKCLHTSHLMEQADDFDIIHNNFDFLPLTYSRLFKQKYLQKTLSGLW